MTKRKKYDTDSIHGTVKRHVQKSPEERRSYVESIKQKPSAGATSEITQNIEDEVNTVPEHTGIRTRIKPPSKKESTKLSTYAVGISLLTFIGGIIYAYAYLVSKMEANNDKIHETHSDIRTIYQDTIKIRERLAKLEVWSELLKTNTDSLNVLKGEIEELRSQLRTAEKTNAKERRALLGSVEKRLKFLESKFNNNQS